MYLNFFIKKNKLAHCFLNSNKLQVKHLDVTIMGKLSDKKSLSINSFLKQKRENSGYSGIDVIASAELTESQKGEMEASFPYALHYKCFIIKIENTKFRVEGRDGKRDKDPTLSLAAGSKPCHCPTSEHTVGFSSSYFSRNRLTPAHHFQENISGEP